MWIFDGNGANCYMLLFRRSALQFVDNNEEDNAGG
jgi:hypothetical protein